MLCFRYDRQPKESSERHVNRTPAHVAAAASRLDIHREAQILTLAEGEDGACTLVSTALIAGRPYREVRELLHKLAPELRLEQRVINNMNSTEVIKAAIMVSAVMSEFLGQTVTPETLLGLERRGLKFTAVPISGSHLVSISSAVGLHCAAAVEGIIYNPFGGLEPMEATPQGAHAAATVLSCLLGEVSVDKITTVGG